MSLYGMTVTWSSSTIARSAVPKAYRSYGVSFAWFRVAALSSAPGLYRVLQTVTVAGLYSSAIFFCKQGGLKGAYYTNADWSEQGLSKVDSTISFDWGGFGPPYIDIPANSFSVWWKGFLKIPQSDVFTFKLSSNDDSFLFLGETLILSAGIAFPQRAATIALNKYTLYPIEIKYRERMYNARIHLL